MKLSKIVFALCTLLLLVSAFKCDDQKNMTCEDRGSQLKELGLKIQNLADASICNENFECRSIAFGSKPCGGPWSYLAYSTSIDTLALTKFVDAYNKHEKLLNDECGRMSDCAIVNPPQRLECENNKCIAIY